MEVDPPPPLLPALRDAHPPSHTIVPAPLSGWMGKWGQRGRETRDSACSVQPVLRGRGYVWSITAQAFFWESLLEAVIGDQMARGDLRVLHDPCERAMLQTIYVCSAVALSTLAE